jgi:hypothetical protein
LRSALVGNGFDCGGENAAVSGFFSKVERALRVGGGKAFREKAADELAILTGVICGE